MRPADASGDSVEVAAGDSECMWVRQWRAAAPVQAHARRQRNGHVDDEAHEEGEDSGRERGGKEDAARRDARVVRAPDDDAVQHHDVAHREEGSNSARESTRRTSELTVAEPVTGTSKLTLSTKWSHG